MLALGVLVAGDRLVRDGRVALAVGCAAAVAGVVAARWLAVDVEQAVRGIAPLIPRPFPLFVAAMAVLAAVRMRRTGDPRTRLVCGVRIGFCVFAVGMLLKNLLAARIQQYGFALAMPAGAVVAAAFGGWIPQMLRERGSTGWIVRGGALGAAFGVALGFWSISDHWYARKTFPIGPATDRFWADDRAQGIKFALKHVRDNYPEEAEVLVLPEGIMLNYLWRRRTPTRFVNFMPPELVLFGEDRMIAELELDPPEVVVLMHKSTAEYGYEFFGRDYGRRLASWIRRRYLRGGIIAQPPLQPGTVFGMQILER